MREVNTKMIQEALPLLRKSLKIAVIYGGDKNKEGAVINKTHNPRSDKTYEYVADDLVASLQHSGFEQVIKLPEDMHLGQALREHSIDMCWLNTGGTQGASSCTHAPATLELAGVPYVGHSPLNAGLLDNKHIFKSLLNTMGIETAAFLVIDPKVEDDASISKRLQQVFGSYQGPFIAKPVSGRASQHVHHVEHRDELVSFVHQINTITHGQVMIEKFLSGREYAMACMGPVLSRKGQLTDLREPFAFSAVERVLEEDEKIFTSMDVKKISNDRVGVLHPDTDRDVWEQMAHSCRRIVQEMNLSAGIRIDFRADAEGIIHVLEANPKPDLKRPNGEQISLVAAGLSQFDLDYEDLIMSMLVNKIHNLITYQPLMAPKIVELLAAA